MGTPLWTPQFDAALNYPFSPLTVRYAVCTAPRSGSHHLGHLLRAHGLGYPLEYLQAHNYAEWSRRAERESGVDTLTYIKSLRTDRGTFGLKLHHTHLSAFLTHEQDVASYRYLTIGRRDLIRQAVSYAWAAQTGAWITGMTEQGPAVYDYQAIKAKLRATTESAAGWRMFFAQRGITTLDLVHEDVLADPNGTIEKVGAFLGVVPSSVPGFIPDEQADAGKAEWAARFLQDSHRDHERYRHPQPARPKTGMAIVQSWYAARRRHAQSVAL